MTHKEELRIVQGQPHILPSMDDVSLVTRIQTHTMLISVFNF